MGKFQLYFTDNQYYRYGYIDTDTDIYIGASLVWGGCTSLVQPVDAVFNSPFEAAAIK